MNLLAIETATEACSVALWLDGDLLERYELAPRGHAHRVLPWAEALLAEAGVSRSRLDAVAVGRGPGAFTGVRLAVAIAQGLALALDRPLIAVSTLAALAEQAEGERALAALDARMGEVYFAAFMRDGQGTLRPISEETVAAPGALVLPEGSGWHGLGTGFACDNAVLRERLGERLLGCIDTAFPRAGAVARLAAMAERSSRTGAFESVCSGLISPEHIFPSYLRQNVALTLDQQRASRPASSTDPLDEPKGTSFSG